MPKNFWLQFAIQEAIVVAEGVLSAQTNLTQVQKDALTKLITDGQLVAQAFGL